MDRENSRCLGLYLHIPFCRQKCFYCDFPSYAMKGNLSAAYTAALCREITAQSGSFADYTVDTIYWGGGTPTFLAIEELYQLAKNVQQNFSLAVDYEWTIEANPGTVTKEKLATLRQSGVNRISFGVQSFEDRLLKKIGRLHTAAQAVEAVLMAQAVGFDNISLDLMYALPGQTMESLADSVGRALALPVNHISIYGLMIEENTVFAKLAKQGKLSVADEELEEAMYDYLVDTLPKQGFKRYEIANFARENAVSRHNLKYWQDLPYLGLGAAASSYVQNERWSNVRRIEDYIELIERGKAAVAEQESLSENVLLEEFCFLALRTTAGINKAAFQTKFNRTVAEVYGKVISELTAAGLLAESATHIFMTPQGFKYGNRVFREFILI